MVEVFPFFLTSYGGGVSLLSHILWWRCFPSLSQAVLALDFHPTVSVLASGSNDCTVKFFDYSRPAVKKSYRSITEVASIKSIKFHPSGEFMVVGTEQPTCELLFMQRSELALDFYLRWLTGL